MEGGRELRELREGGSERGMTGREAKERRSDGQMEGAEAGKE